MEERGSGWDGRGRRERGWEENGRLELIDWPVRQAGRQAGKQIGR